MSEDGSTDSRPRTKSSDINVVKLARMSSPSAGMSYRYDRVMYNIQPTPKKNTLVALVLLPLKSKLTHAQCKHTLERRKEVESDNKTEHPSVHC